MILHGKGVMTMDGQAHEVSEGDVMLNKPYWGHGLENDSDTGLKILGFEV